MTDTKGTLYDGRSSRRTEVLLIVEGERLHIVGDAIDYRYDFDEVALSPSLGKLRPTLIFPDGARCEIAADSPLTGLVRQKRPTRHLQLHRWEASAPRILLALSMIVLLVWLALKFAVPYFAERIAFAIPPATEVALGRQSLQFLDKMFLNPSRLPKDRQTALAKRFRQMTAELPDGHRYSLELRQSDRIGANALALPSGIIVVTDRLVELAKNEAGVVGVLAHEIGHERYRHTLRHLLQNSVTAFIIAAITGDILSASSLSATLPTLLIDAKYCRDFEREADDAAVLYLKSHRIPVTSYIDMLSCLQAEHDRIQGKRSKDSSGDPTDLISTHPPTSERIARIMQGG